LKLDANIDELRKLEKNTRNRSIFIRFIVFCTVTKAIAPGFLRYPKDTLKFYLKQLAADLKGNSHV